VKNIALVTGVSKGIGRGIVAQLAKNNVKVYMMARNEERLSEIEKEMQDQGFDVVSCAADITDRKILNEKVKAILDAEGKIDILVNNAGLMPFPVTLAETEDQLWDDLVNVNLTGTFNVTKAVLPSMLENKYGRIINISSVSARKVVGMFVGYAAAKGGLHAFTAALANEVTTQGITVNCILPGFTETEQMHHIWGTLAELAGITEDEILAPFWQQVPIGRWIQPEEIGAVVAFLASEAAGVVTGQLIKVDGGYDNHE